MSWKYGLQEVTGRMIDAVGSFFYNQFIVPFNQITCIHEYTYHKDYLYCPLCGFKKYFK
jgi:hypothetical protein